MTDTTDQQAVTATLWLERAEHCNPVLPTPNSPMFAAVAEEMEEYAECKVAAITRLASVSSASAEEYKLPCDVHLPHAAVIKAGCDLSTLKLAMEYEHRPRHFEGNPRASLPTPEPVPATNQAGEVERDSIRRSIIRQLGDDPYADRIILNGTDWDIVLEALRTRTAALATQPATSQEGEGLSDRLWLNTILAKHFASHIPDVVERIRVGNAACTEILAVIAAATPTPPTLSEDLREALERLVKLERRVLADMASAHSQRGPGASSEMRSDDRDDMAEAKAAFETARAAIAQGQAS